MMKFTTTLTILITFSGFSLFSQPIDYLMNSSLSQVNDCSGFFLDSGGGIGNYAPNENFTSTICPDGINGTHVQLIFSAPQLMIGDELCFFDGPSIAAPSLGCASDFLPGAGFIIQATAPNPSGCLTITFNSNNFLEGEGWSADINCIASCQTILSIIGNTDPVIEPVDTGYIDICPGDEVFFNGYGEYPQNGVVYSHSDLTSSFEWDFGDGASSSGKNVSHVYDEPGGYVVEFSYNRSAWLPEHQLYSTAGQGCSETSIRIRSLA